MRIGTVANLWRYPVKSLAAESLEVASVEAGGFAGDRSTALIVGGNDHARSGKPYRGKEHQLLHTLTTTAAARQLGLDAGVELQPVVGEHFFDAQPVSLLFDSWLQDVELLVGRTLEPLRYRPNIFAHALPLFTAREAAFVGSAIEIGAVSLRVVATIKRCVTTTYDLATGEPDPAVLREVARERANTVGVYCRVERSGAIMLGDTLVAVQAQR